MRVICIQKEIPDDPSDIELVQACMSIKVGHSYNVVDEEEDMYIFAEFGDEFLMEPKNYIPCSEIDENELVNKKTEVLCE